MRDSATMQATPARSTRARKLDLKVLVGSGEKIGLLVLPFLVIGVALNVLRPEFFSVGGPAPGLRVVSAVMLVPGITIWLWSVVLILAKVPKHELITTGPFALVKHPLYTAVGPLVLPWFGFLLNTWLGVVIGVVVYIGTRIYGPAEEKALAEEFGGDWDEYARSVKLPWL